MACRYACLSVVGILAKDPKLYVTVNKKIICYFSVIYRCRPKVRAIFFHFVTFRQMAEFIHLNYRKGDKIFVTKATAVQPNDYPDPRNPGQIVKLDRWLCWGINDGTEEIKLETFKEDEIQEDL